ncbi:hypothetical protein BH09SUM1_BH09SUM1_26790 [soil metagenome]
MKLTRREILKTIVIGGVAAAAGCASSEEKLAATPTSSGKKMDLDGGGNFSFLHLTDMHVRRKRKGKEGYQACIDNVNALRPLPDFALMGGDAAFDGCYTAKEEYIDQVKIYKEVSDTLKMPYYNSIGNHDPLGWSPRRKVALDDPDIGIQYIMNQLGMERSYYSFNHKGWHFVVLDSIYPITTENGPSQEPRIGEEQLKWLAKDLGHHEGMPTVAMTHIAAFCNMGQINGDVKSLAMTGMVVADNKELRLILERHKVKALLQGHSHMTEDFIYRDVAYLTSPAVSACWWSGPWNGSPYGYTLFHCKGTELSWERKTFEWQTYLEPEDSLERRNTAEYEAELAKQAKLKLEDQA